MNRWGTELLLAGFLLAAVPGTAAAAEARTADEPLGQPLAQMQLAPDPMAATREQQRMLSSMWTFASLNYLYCDVVGLMDSNMLKQYVDGTVNGTKMSESFLLGATVLMEVPMSMVFLSTTLDPGTARIANITAGSLMTVVQAATLAVGHPTSYYLMSSIVEIATTGFITGYSAFAMKPPQLIPAVSVTPDSMAVGLSGRF
jgi:hypothetical protein